MQITRIKGKNFICLKEIDLPVTSKLTRIIGKNANGKTSCLTLIEAIMQGMTPSMVRIGEEKAEGSIEIDDGALVIERTQKITGQGTCKILAPFEMPDGKKKMRPLPVPIQEYLRGLVSEKAFRPLDLLIFRGKERTDYFRRIFKTTLTAELLTGIIDQEDINNLDFSKDGIQVIDDLAGSKGILYARRTEINKNLKQKEALLQQRQSELGEFDISQYRDKSEEIEGAIQSTQTRLSEAKAKEQQAEANRRIIQREQDTIAETTAILAGVEQEKIDDIPNLRLSIVTIKEEIRNLQKMITEKEEVLAIYVNLEDIKNRAIQAKKTAEDIVAAITIEVPDITPIEAKLNELQKQRVVNREQKDMAERAMYIVSLAKEVRAIKSQSDAITETIDTLRKDITQKIIETAAIPVKDLRIIGDDIFVGDKHIDLMSTREQVDIVIQIVEWMNQDKPLKVVCLDRAEVLDDESMLTLAAAIPEGYRFFLTEVYHEGQKIPEDAVMVEGGELRQGVMQ